MDLIIAPFIPRVTLSGRRVDQMVEVFPEWLTFLPQKTSVEGRFHGTRIDNPRELDET